MLVLHNSFQYLNIRRFLGKDKPMPAAPRAWLKREKYSPDGLEIRNQNDVAIEVPARQGKLFAVERPRKVEDQIRLEVGQLLRRPSRQWLLPKITHAIASQDVAKPLFRR